MSSKDRLIIGVDFGTTFSGVAYAYSGNANPPDEIAVIKSWPGGNGITSDKVPSELVYGPPATSPSTPSRASPEPSSSRALTSRSRLIREFDAFGGGKRTSLEPFNMGDLDASLKQAARGSSPTGSASQLPRWGFQLRQDEVRLRCMKLFLDPRQDIPSYISKSDMQDQLQRSGKDAQAAVADYLTELFKHAKETLVRRYGEYFIANTPLEVVLTVPAVWSDTAKNATLKAALQAGAEVKTAMGQNLTLISEPEAAAVYTLKAIQPNSLRKGDNFIVCDAGGGTVDLISYEIKQLSPLRIEESAQGIGACCGAAFLNIRFEEYVRTKLGDAAFQRLRYSNPRSWLAALKAFEEHVKRNFNPAEDVDFSIPLPGVPDNPTAGVEQGFLMLSTSAVGEIFRPIMDEILELVEQQMDALRRSSKRVRGIVLVGGFGQSNCLFKKLQERFEYPSAPPPYPGSSRGSREPEQRIQIMQPVNAWTAVVRGAVLRGLEGTELVLSRKSRNHYGTTYWTTFNPILHPPSCKVWDPVETVYKADDRARWFIKKGQTVSSTEPVQFSFYRRFALGKGEDNWANDWLIVCDDDDAPDSYDSRPNSSTRKLCSLDVNLSEVPRNYWESCRNDMGEKYERLSYDLGMQIESGTLRFDLRVDGKVYGNVSAKFE